MFATSSDFIISLIVILMLFLADDFIKLIID